MKIKYIAFIFLSSMITLGWSTETSESQALEKVYLCVELGGERKGEFLQTKKLSILNNPLLITGHYSVEPDGNLLWTQLKPIQVAYLIEGTSVYRLVDGQREKQSSFEQGAAATMLATMKASLTGNLEQLLQHFNFEVSSENCHWQIIMTPKQESLKSFLRSMELKGTNKLNEISIWEVNDDQTTIELKEKVGNG